MGRGGVVGGGGGGEGEGQWTGGGRDVGAKRK